MSTRHYLGITDCVIIALTLLISAGFGILFRYYAGKQTITGFLMAGKNMSKFPVILSITVTMTSASTILSSPSEGYRYGTQYVMKSVGLALGMIISSYILVPVYFQCGVLTVYEYLELRFGKLTRYTFSAAYVLQMVFYTSVVLYAAVLALSAVTNLSFEISVISVGLCCAFYCTMGGLKAVLWTDVFQTFLMCSCVITVCAAGIYDNGGISNIFKIANAGKRLELLNFSMDLTKRYTFWNCFLRGLWGGLAYYGAGQTEVQRMLSMSTKERAKSVLLLSVLPVMFFHLLCDFMGLIIYGIYHSCDPLLNRNHTGLTKYDQLIPYYIVTRVGAIPGITGLCIAGIFSGSLSTISSVLNSLATVTLVDFLKPVFPAYFNDRKSLITAKFLSALYGIICICFALMYSSLQSLKQIGNSLMGVMEGPMVAVFLIAVLTRKANDKCILFGFLTSFIIMGWIGFGSLISRYIEPTLQLHANNCSSEIYLSNSTISSVIQQNGSTTSMHTLKDFSSDTLIIYKISFNWLPILGTLLTLATIFLAIIVTGWKRNVIPPDSKCLSPVTRFWTSKSSANNAIPPVYQLQQNSGFLVEGDANYVDEKRV